VIVLNDDQVVEAGGRHLSVDVRLFDLGDDAPARRVDGRADRHQEVIS
jgi:hypothetical protein